MTAGDGIGRVVALGAYILDVLGRPVEAIPPGQGSVRLEEIKATAAGTAAGPAVDLAKLGAESISIGVLGDDFEGNVVADLMAEHGCDVTRMVRAEGAKTHISLLFIDENGERNPVMIRPTTAPSLTMDDIDRDAVAAADVLHIGGADQLGDFLDEGLADLIHFARENGTVVTVDVLGAGTDEMRERLAPALREAQFFFPNEGQVAGMTGTDDPGEGAAKLRELLGVETVVGTLGAEGSLIVGADGATPVPAFEIDLVDTTGCGDAYVAGFIIATAMGWDAEAAGWLGAAASGLVATGLGSDSGIVDLPSTLEFLATQAPARIAALARSA